MMYVYKTQRKFRNIVTATRANVISTSVIHHNRINAQPCTVKQCLPKMSFIAIKSIY